MPQREFRVLAINPGSASTKIGVFDGERSLLTRTIHHPEAVLLSFRGKPVLNQLGMRLQAVQDEIRAAGLRINGFDAVAGRGGLLRPVPGGVFRVNQAMLDELRRSPFGEHASNLGAFLAQVLAGAEGPAFVVDPVSVDELSPQARVSGSALVTRRSLSHALNTKAVARRYARECGRPYEDMRLVIAHLGSGISVSAHDGGRMVDVNLAGQEGPFSTERCGGLQLLAVVDLCFSGRYTERQLWDALIREGGIYSYLGTKDLCEVERRIDAGDPDARLIFQAMAWQIAKEIGAMSAALCGRVDAIVLTGGMAHSQRLVTELRAAVEWVAPVVVYPGEDELLALTQGVLRVLRGEEQARDFPPQAPETGHGAAGTAVLQGTPEQIERTARV